MKFLTLFLVLFINLYAVVTIAPVKLGEKSGFSGVVKGSLETKRGNSELDRYTAALRAEYDGADYVLWSDFIYSYGEASGTTNTDKKYAHLRFVHRLLHNINYELFLQSASNEFTKVKGRNLAGAGLRYDADLKEYGELFFGLGAFYEKIGYTTTLDPTERNIRMNSYISYVKKFSKKSKLSYVMYYQPDVEKFDDYIFSHGVELEILIYEKLYVNFVFYYDLDTKPAIGVKELDVSQKTSFSYKF